MKSYSLEGIESAAKAEDELSRILPGQANPWLLTSKDSDVVAYLHIQTDSSDIVCPAISAEISGRHFEDDPAVMEILTRLCLVVGGTVTNDA